MHLIQITIAKKKLLFESIDKKDIKLNNLNINEKSSSSLKRLNKFNLIYKTKNYSLDINNSDNTSNDNLLNSEIDKYLNLKIDDEIYLDKFWIDHKLDFPNLFHLFKKIEQLFSKIINKTNFKNTLLSSDNLEKIIFIKSNFN